MQDLLGHGIRVRNIAGASVDDLDSDGTGLRADLADEFEGHHVIPADRRSEQALGIVESGAINRSRHFVTGVSIGRIRHTGRRRSLSGSRTHFFAATGNQTKAQDRGENRNRKDAMARQTRHVGIIGTTAALLHHERFLHTPLTLLGAIQFPRRLPTTLGDTLPGMAQLDDIGEQDSWLCWLCDEPVDPDRSVNDDRGPSIDGRMTAKKAKKSAKKRGRPEPTERLAHRGCNTGKGNTEAVMPWAEDLFVIDPVPIIATVDRLATKGGRETMCRCLNEEDANTTAAWLLDRISRLEPGLELTSSVNEGGGQYLVSIHA